MRPASTDVAPAVASDGDRRLVADAKAFKVDPRQAMNYGLSLGEGIAVGIAQASRDLAGFANSFKRGIIDPILMKAFYFEGNDGEIIKEVEIPAEYKEAAEACRQHIIVRHGKVHGPTCHMHIRAVKNAGIGRQHDDAIAE